MKDISLNFGALRDSIAKLSSMELMKEDKSATLDEFVKRTSESPNLKKQQLIYKNIQNCKPFEKERLAERFINQNLSMFRNSNWQELIRENKQLRKDLLGNPDVSHVEAIKDGKLFEAVNVLIESVTNPGFSNFEAEGKAYEMVVEHLTREIKEGEEKSEEVDDSPNVGKIWEFITKMAVNNFNERYSHLNESEQKVLNVLISPDSNKIEFLEEIKKESIDTIDKLLEDADKSQRDTLIDFREKMEGMNNVSPAVIDTYILECIDLKQSLSEIL